MQRPQLVRVRERHVIIECAAHGQGKRLVRAEPVRDILGFNLLSYLCPYSVPVILPLTDPIPISRSNRDLRVSDLIPLLYLSESLIAIHIIGFNLVPIVLNSAVFLLVILGNIIIRAKGLVLWSVVNGLAGLIVGFTEELKIRAPVGSFHF